MWVKRLSVKDFRNLKRLELQAAPAGNLLFGANGQGKTATLEALYLLGHGRSFRTTRTSELIQYESATARISAEIETAGVEHRLELQLEPTRKLPRIDDKKIAGIARFLGWLRPVLFAPEEVSLVKGAPAGRRALLDRAIFQADSRFLALARDYLRILRHRNQLLKQGAPAAERAPWDQGLIRSGAELRRQRLDYIERLRPGLQLCYRELSGGREEADIRYPVTTADQETFLAREWEKRREREIQLRQTLIGPHRDDPEFLLDGRSLRASGSQGQQRSFILAFKAAQVLDLEQHCGAAPLLLLDDMTSELDAERQARFFNFLGQRSGQFFLTTTDLALVESMIPAQSRRFRLSGGMIEPLEKQAS